ncbi:hypothetical protein ACFQHV_01000 [Promicromonospora thailandica]|uniref:Uncharacterized protein n=1 Tax=Promicromonospora thailandica TaxID=765201 RepID=A0A9X2G4I9_9MICO|nr:hypothetical protein [Promicromonospora thailandica]MCP2265568.1 hypothetical protein [Promicromonospora thailandica]BFF17131.1 hypothetical protein GCM10025730_06520 [Promicromonospora thailandica]
MTESKTKPAAETPEKAKAPDTTPEAAKAAVQTPENARDVVAAVSRRADGSADQTPGYVVIGETDDDEKTADKD